MKKCSHTAHHSLTELNITPLLDLAFVLLVIFIITTIPPVTEEDLKLPSAVRQMKDPPPKAVYISVLSDGTLFLDKTKMADASEMLNTLIGRRTIDQDLNVIVRGDAKTKYKQIRDVLDVCQQANVLNVKLATDPLK
jgi:biopolymer transport protein ExbD